MATSKQHYFQEPSVYLIGFSGFISPSSAFFLTFYREILYKPNCLLDFSLRNNLLVPAAGDLKRITTSSSHLIYFIARIEGKKIFGRTTNRTTEQKSPKEWRGVRCCLKLPYCNLRCFVATSQPAAVEKAFGDVVAGHLETTVRTSGR